MTVALARPVAWLPGRHLQTVVPSVWPAPAVQGRALHFVVSVADSTSVRVEINRPDARGRGTLVLIHGMCGSAESACVRRAAAFALSRGWIAVRMNMRNAGGTEDLASTLCNAGQSDDVGRVLEALEGDRLPRPFAVAGFSLGGNLALRYAAREGDACLADAVAGVNPPIDLERCSRAIERPANRLYQAYYVRRLRRQLRRIRRARSVAGPDPDQVPIPSVRRFDELYTAPDGGYPTAEAYYADASAGPLLGRLKRPSLVLSATNDPYVDEETFLGHRGHERIRWLLPAWGGHCGYWKTGRPRCWASEAIVEFLESHRTT